MILSSLVSYYDRLHEGGNVPDFGFSIEDIGFAVKIDRQGNLVGEPLDLRTKVNANYFEYKLSIVPYTNEVNARSRNAAKIANFIVDKVDYVFGMSGKSEKTTHHQSFNSLIEEVCPKTVDEGILAVKAFLKKWNPEDSVDFPLWKEMSGDKAKWVAFQLEGENRFIHERPAVKECWVNYLVERVEKEHEKGVSLVDGRPSPIQFQYSQFKFGSGASLVSFNESAYESYGKKRGENAPIGVKDEFKSSAALKYLFRSRKQRIRAGDVITVFWTERDSPLESFMGVLLNPQSEDSDNVQVRKFLEAARKGVLPEIPGYEGDVKTYMLGFSLNKARLAVRFWHVCSVDQFKDRIGQHFNDLEMERASDKNIRYPGAWHLLKETARESKNISPLLGGALMRSILEGANYPMNLYNGVMNRIRVDFKVNYLKASILKAVLKRNFNMEVPMSLDTEKKDIAYLLGRLFAVLEKAQKDALGEHINATIKDRFFAAASSTPASVFPRLLRLFQHHVEKSDYGYVSDRRAGEIMDHIDHFPNHLNLKQQGLFSIAYYQQRNDFYKTKTKKSEGGE